MWLYFLSILIKHVSLISLVLDYNNITRNVITTIASNTINHALYPTQKQNNYMLTINNDQDEECIIIDILE